MGRRLLFYITLKAQAKAGREKENPIVKIKNSKDNLAVGGTNEIICFIYSC
jgi:hypothetical protein